MHSPNIKREIADAYRLTYQDNLQPPLPDETLRRFVEMHNDDDFEQVLIALDYFSQHPRVAPNGYLQPVHPSHVKEKIDPRCSIDGELAFELRTLHEARRKFGRDDATRAKSFLSKLCFDAILTHGDWKKCVNIQGDAEAQYLTDVKFTLRDFIRSQRMGKRTEPLPQERQMTAHDAHKQLYAKDAVRDDNAEGAPTEFGRDYAKRIKDMLSGIGG